MIRYIAQQESVEKLKVVIWDSEIPAVPHQIIYIKKIGFESRFDIDRTEKLYRFKIWRRNVNKTFKEFLKALIGKE